MDSRLGLLWGAGESAATLTLGEMEVEGMLGELESRFRVGGGSFVGITLLDCCIGTRELVGEWRGWVVEDWGVGCVSKSKILEHLRIE